MEFGRDCRLRVARQQWWIRSVDSGFRLSPRYVAIWRSNEGSAKYVKMVCLALSGAERRRSVFVVSAQDACQQDCGTAIEDLILLVWLKNLIRVMERNVSSRQCLVDRVFILLLIDRRLTEIGTATNA